MSAEQPRPAPALSLTPVDGPQRKTTLPPGKGRVPSTVALLPERLRTEVHARLRAKARQKDIIEWLAGEGHTISPAAMARYAKTRRAVDLELGEALDLAAASHDPLDRTTGPRSWVDRLLSPPPCGTLRAPAPWC